MKKKLLLFLFLLFITARAQLTFQQSIGFSHSATASCVNHTMDGGYIITGTATDSSGVIKTFLVKTNSTGDTLWTKIYGDLQYMGAFSVAQTADSGYILCGEALKVNGTKDWFLVKTNPDGTIQWGNKYDFGDNERAYTVRQTRDGGYIIAADINGNGASPYRACAIKTDSAGTIVWCKNFCNGMATHGYSIRQVSDGGYIFSGSVLKQGFTGNSIYLLRIDSLGNIRWEKNFGYGIPSIGIMTDAVPTPDGGYIIATSTDLTGSGYTDAFLAKADSTGDLLWEHTYGNPANEVVNAVILTSSGGYALCGKGPDCWLISLDSTGNIISSTDYINNQFISTTGNSLVQSDDGGFMLAGSNQNNLSLNDVYLIKTDSTGNSGCSQHIIPLNDSIPLLNDTVTVGTVAIPTSLVSSFSPSIRSGGAVSMLCNVGIEESISGETFIISPNPAANQFTIHNAEFTIKNIDIYNLTGEKILNVLAHPDSYRDSNLKLQTIDVSALPAGIYFVNVESNDFKETKKLIIQK